MSNFEEEEELKTLPCCKNINFSILIFKKSINFIHIVSMNGLDHLQHNVQYANRQYWTINKKTKKEKSLFVNDLLKKNIGKCLIKTNN